MKIFGVICEYNPFHKGHLYQLAKTREMLGEESLCIAVMSGDFVQRGEAAQFSKFARAEAACRCGADLVFELPVQYCLSSAEGFARAAVDMLSRLGCGYLSFGSESADTQAMFEIAHELLLSETQVKIKALLNAEPNLSYAAARQRILTAKIPQAAYMLSEPNDILAIEYIKSVIELETDLQPLAVRRIGAAHDTQSGGEIRCATELRAMLDRGGNISAYIPHDAAEVFTREADAERMKNSERMSLLIMSRLRMLMAEDFARLPDASGGAGERLFHAVRDCGSLESVINTACTKRYTAARMRRMCLCAALRLSADCTNREVTFARLLAANRRGCAYLSKAENLSISILSKPAAVKQMSEQAQRVFASGVFAHDLYTLQFEHEEDKTGGNDWKTSPIIV